MLPEETENRVFKNGSGLTHKEFKAGDSEKWRGGTSVLR